MSDKNSLLVDCRFISRLQGKPPRETVYLRRDDVVGLLRSMLSPLADKSDIAELAATLERIER